MQAISSFANLFVYSSFALLLLLCSCSVKDNQSIDSTLDTRVIQLLPAEATCPSSVSWQKITPGHTTYDEMVQNLGEPDEIGAYLFPEVDSMFRLLDEHAIPFAAYRKSEGTFSHSVAYQIFFRPDRTVDWIEIMLDVTEPASGNRYTVQHLVDQLGSKPERIFANGWYDVEGLDEVFLWPACGLAAISICHDPQRTSFDEQPELQTCPILMEVVFQPTTLKGFFDHYAMRFPYGAWDESLQFSEMRASP